MPPHRRIYNSNKAPTSRPPSSAPKASVMNIIFPLSRHDLAVMFSAATVTASLTCFIYTEDLATRVGLVVVMGGGLAALGALSGVKWEDVKKVWKVKWEGGKKDDPHKFTIDYTAKPGAAWCGVYGPGEKRRVHIEELDELKKKRLSVQKEENEKRRKAKKRERQAGRRAEKRGEGKSKGDVEVEVEELGEGEVTDEEVFEDALEVV